MKGHLTVSSWNPETLRDMPTLSQGQCCDLKIETDAVRVWLCRDPDGCGVTVEQYHPASGRWDRVMRQRLELWRR